ncbi:FtsX-like permease family protein [Stigmatella aurantiaca]|uniref:ABC transporter permease n=1 Tax=Stigmatella aurantiaca (strain DW4/3-1) TaxID=378806 RepID=Q099Z5_STIAD|nr:ABC transporter permease [Stigmatella aurantiaca]ADO68944.1 ABC transporter, permease protein [Stigmatella aurantiaca DW4/3-1]APZ78818.1 ABC transporter permease [Stigmatella aurantiaca DW4/3-1]EAU68613.1 ABC transporter, permease protein [Stigmatella aurantiaca DW4/3-1]
MSRRLLARASARHLAGHPWLTALSLLGIALGVAVVVSIDLASNSALQAFAQSTDTVAGQATHQLVGGPSGLPASLYSALRLRPGAPTSAPVVEGHVRAANGDRRPLTLLGVDPFAEAPFRPYARDRKGSQVTLLLTEPGTVLMTASTARLVGATAPGDTFEVAVGGQRRTLRVLDFLAPSDERTLRALEGLLLADVSTAQEVLGLTGRLSRIDLKLGDEAEEARLRQWLPPGVDVLRAVSRGNAVDQMTRAFRTNLTALSLLALVVGMFLIYNTMTFSVVQRRGLLGRLRALGITRGELFALVLGEAALLGAVGTAAGLLLGVLLGRGLVGLVTQTINDLYFVVSVRRLSLEPLMFAKGVALGLGATLGAALVPAWEAARSPPVTTMRRSTAEDMAQGRAPKLALLGLLILGAGTVLLVLPTHSLSPAYVGLFSVQLGAALLVPWMTERLVLGAAHPLGAAFGMLGRMAARGVRTSLSRTSVALAALMIAVATTVGVGLMVASFRGTVVEWLESSLQADVYATPPSLMARRGDSSFVPGLAERLSTTPGVAASATIRSVKVNVNGIPTDLTAIAFPPNIPRQYRFKEGDAATVWRELEALDTVIISEPLSFHHNLHRGSTLHLATDHGPRDFRVLGVYYDFGSDVGAVLMPRATYDAAFEDRGVTSLALYAAPGQDVDALVERMRERIGDAQIVNVRSNRVLREGSLEVFDRTFTITQVLRLLAVGVAFVGVLSALMALQLERAREFAVLRATGLTPGQLWGLVSLQTGLLGLLAGLFAVPLGLALAHILVHVINQRSFGWTLQLVITPGVLIQAVVLALAAAGLAGVYPAWRMSRANPALALREE